MRTKVFLLLIISSIGVSVMVSCGHNDATEQAYKSNNARIDSTSTSTAQARQAKNDADFLVFASNVGNFEIQAGRLAEEKSKNKMVRDFAMMMIEDHTKLGKNVSTLATQKNITLPADLGMDLRNELNKLDSLSGKEFDKEYAAVNVKGHAEAIARFEQVTNSSNYSSDVMQFASIALPVLRKHKEHADTLQAAIKPNT